MARDLIESYTGDAYISPLGDGELWAEFPVTAGVLDEEALEALTNGYCWMFAIELHRATGWPIALVSHLNALDNPSREQIIESWTHAVAVAPGPWLCDATGTWEPDDLAIRCGMGSTMPAAIAYDVPASRLMKLAAEFNPLPTYARRHNWSLTRTFVRSWLANMPARECGPCEACSTSAQYFSRHADDCPYGPDYDFARYALMPELMPWSRYQAKIPA
jgi:hypothetical protein